MTAQYLEILNKVRAGTHRIRSYRVDHQRTRYVFEYLNKNRNEWITLAANQNVLRRASKQLSHVYSMHLGVVYVVAA